MEEKEVIRKQLLDADRAAYERNILKTCGFLALDEQSICHSLEREFQTPPQARFFGGGYEGAERTVAFFLPDYLDRTAAEQACIAAIKVSPANARFAEELTHRDYLGALMNLGIERFCIGDILRTDGYAVIFVLREMAELICRELTRVRHTQVECRLIDGNEPAVSPEFENLTVNIASERVDAVVAAVFRVSRQKAADAVNAERIFLNGSVVHSAGKTLKAGDRISVRGAGKFIFDGISGSSRKGRLFAEIRKYR